MTNHTIFTNEQVTDLESLGLSITTNTPTVAVVKVPGLVDHRIERTDTYALVVEDCRFDLADMPTVMQVFREIYFVSLMQD